MDGYIVDWTVQKGTKHVYLSPRNRSSSSWTVNLCTNDHPFNFARCPTLRTVQFHQFRPFTLDLITSWIKIFLMNSVVKYARLPQGCWLLSPIKYLLKLQFLPRYCSSSSFWMIKKCRTWIIFFSIFWNQFSKWTIQYSRTLLWNCSTVKLISSLNSREEVL